MFSDIARRYDVLNRILSLGTDVRWRRELAAEVPVSGTPVLDLATGTADVAITLRRTRPGLGLVVGADFALPMLRIASGKVSRSGGIQLCAADALALPFGDGSFGALTIAFGLRNLPHRQEALAEMARVIRPSGRLVILEFSRMNRPLAGPLFRFYFHFVMPLLGGIISGNIGAYRYLPRSVEDFPDPAALALEMTNAGFLNVRYRPLSMGIAFLHIGERPD